MSAVLYHFSEDPSIDRFIPHVPRSNPTHAPAVWAIDELHDSLYWFPRDCPRVTAWIRSEHERPGFRDAFCTAADRVHAIEAGWLQAMRTVTLYRYQFDGAMFHRWPDASGQWISDVVVEPVGVDVVGDLLARHVDAGIELRITRSLWPIHNLAHSDGWDFSIVRMSNARPRT